MNVSSRNNFNEKKALQWIAVLNEYSLSITDSNCNQSFVILHWTVNSHTWLMTWNNKTWATCFFLWRAQNINRHSALIQFAVQLSVYIIWLRPFFSSFIALSSPLYVLWTISARWLLIFVYESEDWWWAISIFVL